jgi:hypothetical protein
VKATCLICGAEVTLLEAQLHMEEHIQAGDIEDDR